MILYAYDKQGYYLRPVSPSLDPAKPQNTDGSWNYLRPSMTTDEQPPLTQPNEVARWDGTSWAIVPNYTNRVVWSIATREAMLIQGPGALPLGYTLQQPPGDDYTWSVDHWEIDLPTARENAYNAIDNEAERRRLLAITHGAGQALAYVRKYAEATEFLRSTSPNPSDFPFLSAEVGITAPDMTEVATVIKTGGDAWYAYGAAIEHARLGAKATVKDAESSEAITSIVNSINWPTL